MDIVLMTEKYFFWLIVYSMIGWVYESILVSVRTRSLVNRGFLNGPYCPIYGFGAILDILLLGWAENPVLLFFLGVIVTCTLEYLTPYLMEKLFHSRWWDYSESKFNINGRVCLAGALVFGTMSVLLIKIIHPFIVRLTDKVPYPLFHFVCAGLFLIIVMDMSITIAGFIGFDEKLKVLEADLKQAREEFADGLDRTKTEFSANLRQTRNEIRTNIDQKLQNSALYEKLGNVYSGFSKTLSTQQLRMIHAFPKLRSMKYTKATEELRKHIFKK